MNTIEDKIAEIIRDNDVSIAAKVVAEIMRNIAKNDPVVADNPDGCVNYEIDSACEEHFG
jgi:hypothetical protein